jgi:class 3 adenylate cyclase
VQSLGIDIRAGVHTGEVEVVGDGVRGIAVHIGARVSALASAGEVLVSSTVRDLSQGRVCNSRTVVPASSRVCRTHGGFSR